LPSPSAQSLCGHLALAGLIAAAQALMDAMQTLAEAASRDHAEGQIVSTLALCFSLERCNFHFHFAATLLCVSDRSQSMQRDRGLSLLHEATAVKWLSSGPTRRLARSLAARRMSSSQTRRSSTMPPQAAAAAEVAAGRTSQTPRCSRCASYVPSRG